MGSPVPGQEPSIKPEATTGPCKAAERPSLRRWQPSPLTSSPLAHFGKALKKLIAIFYYS